MIGIAPSRSLSSDEEKGCRVAGLIWDVLVCLAKRTVLSYVFVTGSTSVKIPQSMCATKIDHFAHVEYLSAIRSSSSKVAQE